MCDFIVLQKMVSAMDEIQKIERNWSSGKGIEMNTILIRVVSLASLRHYNLSKDLEERKKLGEQIPGGRGDKQRAQDGRVLTMFKKEKKKV